VYSSQEDVSSHENQVNPLQKKHQGPDSKHHFGAFLSAKIRFVATMIFLALT